PLFPRAALVSSPPLFPYTTLFRSLALARRTIAVAVQVHPDLVRPAERQEDEFVAGVFGHAFRDGVLRRQISSRPRMVRSASKRSDRKSTRLNSSHVKISYAVFCLK